MPIRTYPIGSTVDKFPSEESFQQLLDKEGIPSANILIVCLRVEAKTPEKVIMGHWHYPDNGVGWEAINVPV